MIINPDGSSMEYQPSIHVKEYAIVEDKEETTGELVWGIIKDIAIVAAVVYIVMEAMSGNFVGVYMPMGGLH
jgi:hypothetical protein